MKVSVIFIIKFYAPYNTRWQISQNGEAVLSFSSYTPNYLNVLLDLDNQALLDDTLSVIYYPEYRDCRVIRTPKSYFNKPISFGFPVGEWIDFPLKTHNMSYESKAVSLLSRY